MMNFNDEMESKPFVDNNGLPIDQQMPQQPSIMSFYPLPPMRYIKEYREINIRNNCAPPPPKPFLNGTFLMFGQNVTIDDAIIRSLESQNLRRLYPREYDHKRELKKMNASILASFLDLIDVLIRCPDTPKREDKNSDLVLLFITMHHLINELRPHQARESIRCCLEKQKKERQECSSRLLKQIERVQDIIQNAVKGIICKDISSLLQESLPENFERSNNKNNDIDPNIDISKDYHQQGTTTTTQLDLNRFEDQNKKLNGYYHYQQQQSSSTFQQDLQNCPLVNKMAELDAFMCDCVDSNC